MSPPVADNLEMLQVASALVGALMTARTIYVTVCDLRQYPDTRLAAQRRLRQHSFTLIVQLVLLIVGVVTLFLSNGEMQSGLRSFAMSIGALVLGLSSLTDQWEYAPWKGADRRKPLQP